MSLREWNFAIIAIVAVVAMMLVSVDITINKFEPKPLKDKRVKCVDGTLYEELHTGIFITSHLQCFEEKKK